MTRMIKLPMPTTTTAPAAPTASRRPTRRPAASRAARRVVLVDVLEGRALFAAPWGSAPQRISLDDLAANQPQITGAGQTIAILDTGIDYNHVSLGGGFGAGKKVIAGYDFVDGDTDPMDTNGHGTAVAGIAAADAFEQGGFSYRGVAPGAKLVALRIAADTSSVPLERIERGLQWVNDHASDYGITVVNLSFGFGAYDTDHAEEQFSDELAALKAKGIAFVSSSGNAGTGDGTGITYPAADPDAYSVGSVNAGDVISEFTQRSVNLDLLAVGENVFSTKRGGTYAAFNGTSFAAPAAAGAFALARQVDSSFTLADVASMLSASAAPNVDGDAETGAATGITFKRLDVEGLVTLALTRKAGTSAQQNAVGDAGARNNYVVDPYGVGHFVYYDDDSRTMKYATRSAGGRWSAAVTVDNRPNVGTEFSLKLDAQGRPRIAYLDGPNGDLKFASLDDAGAGWQLETLEDKGVVGIYPSLAIGDDGSMYVAYLRKTNADLKFVEKVAGGSWVRQTVDADYNVGYSATLALDHEGHVGIAYGDETNNQLRYVARDADGDWSKTIVDGNVVGAAYLSLAYNADNSPRISYYEVRSSDLKFASRQDNNSWRLARLASKGATGLYTNLCIDSDDTARVYYWDRRTNATFVATGSGQNSGSFALQRVAAGGRYLSLSTSPLDGSQRLIGQVDGRLVIDDL